MKFASIIIPVYNDAERLKLCLKALSLQTYPKNLFEIIVIDNNSQDNLELALSDYPQVRLCFESKPGSYNARNTGLKIAQGEIIAFTDSDCIPDPEWLEQGVKTLISKPDCSIIGGKVEFFFQNPGRPNAVELYDSITHLQQKIYTLEFGFATTANLFTYKKLFEEIGYFNENLKSGGDEEWGKRASARGYIVAYAENSLILHPARRSWAEISRKLQRTAGGYFTRNQPDSSNLASRLKWYLYILGKFKPPLRSHHLRIFSDDRLRTVNQKLAVLLLTYRIHYLDAVELARLQLGHQAVR